MRTLLKALPDFFLCILRSLPYLNKPVFIKGDLWQWKVPARVPSRLYWDLPSSRRYCPACRFIYLFSLIYLFISFIFNFFIFYFSLSSRFFIFIFYFMWDTCAMHSREGKWRKRPKNEDVAPCNNEKLTRGYIGLN